MQRNSLRPQQIIARREILRDRHIQLPAIRVEVLGAPVVVRAGGGGGCGAPGVFVDLEEGGGAVGGGGVGYFG